MKLICLISHPRSGSTSLMKKIERETKTAAVLEIFHPIEEVICQHLTEGLGEHGVSRLKDTFNISEVRNFAIENPVEYLEEIKKLSKENGKENVIFKIFPGHIKNNQKLNDIISFSQYVLFLRRNTLQSYISNKKAIAVGTYANIDTSSIKVEFSSQEFLQWRNNIYFFFNTVEDLVKKSDVPSNWFNYEELYSKDKSFVTEMYGKMDITSSSSNSTDVMRKQDTSSFARQKVNNPDTLMSYLRENKLEALDEVTSIDKFS